jgi:hypothetical protein
LLVFHVVYLNIIVIFKYNQKHFIRSITILIHININIDIDIDININIDIDIDIKYKSNHLIVIKEAMSIFLKKILMKILTSKFNDFKFIYEFYLQTQANLTLKHEIYYEKLFNIFSLFRFKIFRKCVALGSLTLQNLMIK